MTLNVQRVFTLCQKLVPLLKKGAEKRGGGVGRIINVSPGFGLGVSRVLIMDRDPGMAR